MIGHPPLQSLAFPRRQQFDIKDKVRIRGDEPPTNTSVAICQLCDTYRCKAQKPQKPSNTIAIKN